MRRTMVLAGFSLLMMGCSPSRAARRPVDVPPGFPVADHAFRSSQPRDENDKWWLWTQGTQLRGANIYQRRVYPELDGPEFMGYGLVGPPYVQEDFDRLASLGANYVNISHPGIFIETSPYLVDQKILENLDNLLEMIGKADMFAVISYRTGPGRSEFTFHLDEVGDWFDEDYLNDRMWLETAAQDAWVAMWAFTAQRYRVHPIVVGYDLMVEPNVNEVFLDLWDPEEFSSVYEGTLFDWNQLHPRISETIRSVDPDTPILIGGMGYSAIDWLPSLTANGDDRTVYTFHQYAPFEYTHQDSEGARFSYPGQLDVDGDGVEETFDRVWLEDLFSTAEGFIDSHDVPLAVNEFGAIRWVPGAATFVADQISILEEHGMNYAIWVWDPSWGPWLEEVSAFNFRFGPDPENTSDQLSNELLDVLVRSWAQNVFRPSTFGQ